jgi:hypothetical protein
MMPENSFEMVQEENRARSKFSKMLTIVESR